MSRTDNLTKPVGVDAEMGDLLDVLEVDASAHAGEVQAQVCLLIQIL